MTDVTSVSAIDDSPTYAPSSSFSSSSSSSSTSSIRRIDRSSVHRICSNQVIVDLSVAAKELVENALDAGATTITVNLENHAARKLEVSDNGSGVTASNYEGLVRKHWTSKIRTFTDLGSVLSFGFRGEALSSLAAMADLQVCTRCEGQATATLLTYNHDGELISQRAASRTVGTTVTLTNLFATLPVRHKVFLKNLKKEYAKMVNVLQSYAMVCKGVRLHVYNTTFKDVGGSGDGNGNSNGNPSAGGNRSLVMSTQGSNDMRDLISNVLGSKQIIALQEVHAVLKSNEEFALKTYEANVRTDDFAAATPNAPSTSSSSPTTTSSPSSNPNRSPFQLVGFISKLDPKCGRSASDRQYLFINNRPVDLPKMCKLINEAYRACNAQTSYPVFVLNLLMPSNAFDVNLTPNKREILLHDETALLGLIREYFVKIFEPTMYTYQVKDLSQFGIVSMNSLTSPPAAGSSQPIAADDNNMQNSPPDEFTISPNDDDDSSPFIIDTPSKSRSNIDVNSPAISASKQQPSPTFASFLPTSSPPLNIFTAHLDISSPPNGLMGSATSLLKNKRSTPPPPIPILPPIATAAGAVRLNDSFATMIKQESLTAKPLSTHSSVSTTSPPSSNIAALLTPVRVVSAPAPHLSSAENRSTTTPTARTPSAAVRSFNSFLKGIPHTSSVPVEPTQAIATAAAAPTPVIHSLTPRTPTVSTSALTLSPSEAEAQRAAKRQRTNSIDGMPLSGPAFSRQATLKLEDNTVLKPEENTQPLDELDAFDNPSPVGAPVTAAASIFSPPSSLDLVTMNDDTDIGIEYHHQTARTIAGCEESWFEEFYSSDKLQRIMSNRPSVSPKDTDGSSLFQRAAALLSPSTAVASSLHAAASLGAEASSSAATSNPHIVSEESMRRVIEKSDFLQMEIIGQFNLGFIIGRNKDDLFIIDQHATDEKYRFETLQANTVLNSQPLLNPLPLDLSPAMEVVAREHVDVFRKNGFELIVPRDQEEGSGAGSYAQGGQDEASQLLSDEFNRETQPDQRIRVRCLPFSKNLTFGASDIYELCALLAEAPANASGKVRLPKVMSMFASRACRSSVMIGTALNKQQMSTIVKHMADLEHPWACPHGRPTMRHLFDLSALRQFHQLHQHTSEMSLQQNQRLAKAALEVASTAVFADSGQTSSLLKQHAHSSPAAGNGCKH